MNLSIQWMADEYKRQQRWAQGLRSLTDLSIRPRLLGESREYVPVPGVYAILDLQDKVIYVGQSKDVYERMSQHVDDKRHDMWEHGATQVQYVIENDEAERLKYEKFLISLHDPICNRQKPAPIFNPRPYGLAAARLGFSHRDVP